MVVNCHTTESVIKVYFYFRTWVCVHLDTLQVFERRPGYKIMKQTCQGCDSLALCLASILKQITVECVITLGRLKLNVCFASGNFGNWMCARENTTHIPEIYTSICGQKWHDLIGIISWQDAWPPQYTLYTLPFQVFTIILDRHTFESLKWVLYINCFSYKRLEKHSRAPEWKGMSYSASEILCVFFHI